MIECELARNKLQEDQCCMRAGIDTSNIMQGGRRPRRAAALAVNYAQLEGSPGSDASDGDEEKEDDEDDDSGSDSDMADAASEGSEDDGTTKGAGPARKKVPCSPVLAAWMFRLPFCIVAPLMLLRADFNGSIPGALASAILLLYTDGHASQGPSDGPGTG